jgi:DNA-directed RNA polymerase subunit RPC12/RpoP
MIVLKSCIRCQGDVHLKVDQYGEYLNCLQCGSTTEVPGRIDVSPLPDIA